MINLTNRMESSNEPMVFLMNYESRLVFMKNYLTRPETINTMLGSTGEMGKRATSSKRLNIWGNDKANCLPYVTMKTMTYRSIRLRQHFYPLAPGVNATIQ